MALKGEFHGCIRGGWAQVRVHENKESNSFFGWAQQHQYQKKTRKIIMVLQVFFSIILVSFSENMAAVSN
jgi:hypothetical protein